MFTDTNEVNTSLTRFMLGDAETLRHIVPASCLILPHPVSMLFPQKTCFQDGFKAASSHGPAVQTVPIKTSFKPVYSHHIETGQQLLQLTFLRLIIFPIFLPPKGK